MTRGPRSSALVDTQFDQDRYAKTWQDRVDTPRFHPVLYIIVHVVFGFVLFAAPSASTIHAYITIGIGILCALSRSRIHAGIAASYIVGAEVLWRMTNATFFWEGGKYAVVLILGLSLLHHKIKQIPIAPLLYFVLLLPSTVLTLYAAGLSQARELISFNLSGPFTLFISAWYFSGLRITRTQLVRILLFMTLPIVTTATYALLRTLSAPEIQWVNDSMFQTSGGFGPNQVSTIMGLGIVATWIILLLGRLGLAQRIVAAALGIVFFIQGLLTFSRGGMVVAVIVVSFMALHATTSREQRTRLFLILLLLVPVVIFAVIPFLDQFTQGLLQVRFTDPGLSNRDAILAEELTLFQENPIAGIGPGAGTIIRGVASHTEITRLLAEHGMLGLASLVVLFGLAVQRYLRSRNSIERGLCGSLVLWSVAVMTNAAMRIAAISFTFGLACAHIDHNDD